MQAVNQLYLVSVDRLVLQPDVVMESSVKHKMWSERMEDEPPVSVCVCVCTCACASVHAFLLYM